MTKEIYRKHGLKNGFYAGFLPSLVRGVIKQLYRWPLMLVLPQFYNVVIPQSLKASYSSLPKIATGMSLAAIDTFIVCPLERLKVCLQTKRSDLNIRTFFKENNREMAKSLFRGLEPLFYRQMLSWVSFLYTDFKFKELARKWSGLGPKDSLDNSTLLAVSVAVGVSNIMIVMPLDTIKTLYQQHSEEYYKLTLRETSKVVFQKGGLKAFYYGWQPRLVQYVIQSLFTVTALEKLEEKMRKNS
jgi:Mitochondrial carrier protein.